MINDILISNMMDLISHMADRLHKLEAKADAIQFYFEHVQIDDEQVCLTDSNLNVLIRELQSHNQD